MSANLDNCLDCNCPTEGLPEVNPLVDDFKRVIGVLCPACAIKRIQFTETSVDTSEVPTEPTE